MEKSTKQGMSKIVAGGGRLVIIDLLRLISVIIIFFFHSRIYIKGDYGFLSYIIKMGAVFMTPFFMLSGFSLCYVNLRDKGLKSPIAVVNFYKKRICSIMPLYWFIVVTYPVYDVMINKHSLFQNIVLFPVEFLGLQGVFHSLFDFTHNGGSWFVSCILFCYLGFPYYFELAKSMKLKTKIWLIVFFNMILLYSTMLAYNLGVDLKPQGLYSNVFFRTLEFVIGILLCLVWSELKNKILYQKIFARWNSWVLCMVLLFVIIDALVRNNIFVDYYLAYSGFTCWLFCLLFICSAGIKAPYLEMSGIFNYAVKISYAFFFAQYYTWYLTRYLLAYWVLDNNIVRIILPFAICIVLAILMHEVIEKPGQKLLNKILYKRTNTLLR